MNNDNYATLEASKRLVEAGIVLETEFYWVSYHPHENSFMLGDKSSLLLSAKSYYAPSMAEVWRELPEGSFIEKNGESNGASTKMLSDPIIANTNPTDALIDLLIWLRKEEADEG